MEWNKVWALGRKSKIWYLRIYPNPGFMIPWFGGKRGGPEAQRLSPSSLSSALVVKSEEVVHPS